MSTKTLNFFPYYEPYLRLGRKTTTLRLGNPTELMPGQDVMLTVGWQEELARPLHVARVKAVYQKPIGQLTGEDLDGESPDCASAEAARLVLGAIYRTVLTESESIYVIKFEHAGPRSSPLT